MVSMERFKKSFRCVRSAFGKRAMMASRAVLEKCNQVQGRDEGRKPTYFFVTVIKSWVLR
jgi:hypothetical protein